MFSTIYFVGDSAFPLKTYMLHPFPGRFLPEDKQIFNYCLSGAPWVIQNTFGIMAWKSRIFKRSIVVNPDKVTKITWAACCMHNNLRISEINNPPCARFYCPSGFVDLEDNAKTSFLVTGGQKFHLVHCKLYSVLVATPTLGQLLTCQTALWVLWRLLKGKYNGSMLMSVAMPSRFNHDCILIVLTCIIINFNVHFNRFCKLLHVNILDFI